MALQAAGVALLSEDLGRLAAAHRLSKRTATVIRQNLMFAIGAMLVLVIGAAMFDLPLPLAVVGHEGGTVLVVLNGLRLLHDPIRDVSHPVAQTVTGSPFTPDAIGLWKKEASTSLTRCDSAIDIESLPRHEAGSFG